MSIISTLRRLCQHAHRHSHRDPRERQRGAVAIIAAIFLLAMIGTAAFAIDLGRWFVVKNELQNAADAAALAGASHLYPPIQTGPNWDQAETRGENAIGRNASDKEALSTGDVETGYWDYSNQTFDPDNSRVQGANDRPAVRVTIKREAEENMGPVAMTFGRIFGTDTMDVAATATAVASAAGVANEGTLAPFAVSNCMMEPAAGLWDDVAHAPIGNPPQKFIIASGAANNNHCDVGEEEQCHCGQWASSDGGNMNSASAMRDRIINGNENPVQVAPGNEVGIVNTTDIAPGVMNTLYQTADDYWTNNDIRVVLVDGAAVLGKKGPNTPVVGFACLHVHRVSTNNDECRTADGDGKGPVLPGALGGNGKGKCLVVSFSTSEACFMPGGGEGISGTYTGVPLPPRLVE